VNDVLARMMARYSCRRLEDYVRALREILQELALLGLWRSKFFEQGAFYGGTSLRLLHGLDRYSEDLDFSLLTPQPEFDLGRYSDALQTEMRSFGFEVTVNAKAPRVSAIQSAFIKANTLQQLLVIETQAGSMQELPRGQVLKIKLEVDTNPPPGFATESRYLLHPIPFSVRTYTLPDLFAGKIHAMLCRKWKTRVKGRDWYDFVWFVANHPHLHLGHLEQRMVQSGDWVRGQTLTGDNLHQRLTETIDRLDVNQARNEVMPFVVNTDALAVWSQDFFKDLARRIQLS